MSEATSVWKRIAEGAPRPAHTDRNGIWDALRDRLNPALYRPVQSPEVSAVPFTSRRGHQYYILSHRARHRYLRLGSDEYYLWSLMDGTHTVKDLLVEYFTTFGALAFSLVGHLVLHLRAAHMLADAPINMFAGLRRVLDRGQWRAVPRHLLEIVTGHRTLATRRVDHTIGWVHRHGGWVLYTRPVLVLYLGLCAVGGWFFIRHMASGRYPLFQSSGSYTRGMLALVVLNFAGVAIHEFAHALTCKHYGARVNGAGVMLYFGSPAFFIDTTDIWTKPARARMATSWAGPYSGFILAGLASIVIELIPSSRIAPVLHKLAFLWILILVYNLTPLVELDGYFLLIDWLDLPMLRRKSLDFVRSELWGKLRRREPLSGEQRLLAWFGALSLAFSILIVVSAFRFWQSRSAVFVHDLWAGGGASRILLVLLLLVLTLPLVAGFGSRAFHYSRTATTWARARWRQPRSRTRRERIALLRGVRFLAPLSEDQLADVVAKLQRASFPSGATVIRQGEVGDRFYVVERGEAEVFVGENGDPRTVLTAGDYFGELALLHNVPRTATVRARSRLSVVWLGKGDFEQLLGGHVGASAQIDEAIYALERLRDFSIFARLSSRELDELASRLRRAQLPAGTTVVEEEQVGDAFYLIDSGQAEVLVEGRRVRIIGRGDYFGEIALVLDVPRTATVRALTPLDVFILHRDDFAALVSTVLAQVADSLEAVARDRLGGAADV